MNSEFTAVQERLHSLTSNSALFKVLLDPATDDPIRFGHIGSYTKLLLDRSEFNKGYFEETELRTVLFEMGFKVTSAVSSPAPIWAQIAEIERYYQSRQTIRYQQYRRINDDTKPSSYQDPEWMFVVSNPNIEEDKVLEVIRFMVTRRILNESLPSLTHSDIEGLISHQFGRTMVIEAATVNPAVEIRHGVLDQLIRTVGYLGTLDYARRHDLAIFRAEEQIPPCTDYQSRYNRKKCYVYPPWPELALMAKFGRGVDPHQYSENYYYDNKTGEASSIGWVVLTDPIRQPSCRYITSLGNLRYSRYPYILGVQHLYPKPELFV